MEASGWLLAWVAVQTGVREPLWLLCACYPSLLVKVRWLAVAVLGVYCNVAMSELTRCVFAMLGARGCVFRDM